jgi:hypothetical protein
VALIALKIVMLGFAAGAGVAFVFFLTAAIKDVYDRRG